MKGEEREKRTSPVIEYYKPPRLRIPCLQSVAVVIKDGFSVEVCCLKLVRVRGRRESVLFVVGQTETFADVYNT